MSVLLVLDEPRRSKRAIDRVADPYVGFSHVLVAPLLRAGSIGLVKPQRLFRRAIAPRIDEHMGPVFERICREHAGPCAFSSRSASAPGGTPSPRTRSTSSRSRPTTRPASRSASGGR